ncbi:N-methylhydantoinase A/oxoprolinase/acetone carboxylase beta subunit [Bradyrhizobium sp. RT10b]
MSNVGSETCKVRTGVDVGGTFTDLVLVDQNTGKIFLGKRLTTHADPSRAILGGSSELRGNLAAR